MPLFWEGIRAGGYLGDCNAAVPLSHRVPDIIILVRPARGRDRFKSLSENGRALEQFAVPWEQSVPDPFSSDGSRIGSKQKPPVGFGAGRGFISLARWLWPGW